VVVWGVSVRPPPSRSPRLRGGGGQGSLPAGSRPPLFPLTGFFLIRVLVCCVKHRLVGVFFGSVVIPVICCYVDENNGIPGSLPCLLLRQKAKVQQPGRGRLPWAGFYC